MIRIATWESNDYRLEWPDGDSGLWDGPLMNWTDSHARTIRQYCKQFDTVIQAGGAAGMYPKFLSTMFKHVYTFEPEHINFNCLAINCPEENIVKINGALSDGHHMVRVNRANAINAGTHTTTIDRKAYVPAFMIDDLMVQQCDLIMLDLEGFEIGALQGAQRTLKTFRPIVFAENGHSVQEFMSTLNYKAIGNSYADVVFTPVD